MHPDDSRRYSALLIIFGPLFGWFFAASQTEQLEGAGPLGLIKLANSTLERPWLIGGLIAGLAVGILLAIIFNNLGKSEFKGAAFKRHLRGTKIESPAQVSRKTREPAAEQILVGGLPMPLDIEQLHVLVCGSTGSGKSVLLNSLVYSALLRGDRAVIVDPNGSMFAKFGRPGDRILNPYDARTEGWTFFNEVRADYDFERLALSLVPRGPTSDAEEWRAYARLLIAETARKLKFREQADIKKLFHWTTIEHPDKLKAFLAGTAAESLFVGAEKALASARFVLSSCLPAHIKMPDGRFSIRDWLEDPTAGNLYLTWNEAQAESLKPLVSAWVDVLCTSVLSLPEDPARRVWLVVDELASLAKLASLEAAATKGRKAGLRLVVGLQSTAQLDEIYGAKESQILRSCFRSLVVLGGSKTDPQTREDMSLALGEHEVERRRWTKSIQEKGASRSAQVTHERERVVMPSEIADLPDLTGFVAFAGDYPIARVKLKIMHFVNRNTAIEERAA